MKVFVDTSALLLAFGGPHPLREPSRDLIEQAAAHRVELHASTEAIQEFLHHRMRRGSRADALAAARAMGAACVLHAFDGAVLRRSLDLVELTGLRGRDAVHAATAIEHGFGQLVTADADFGNVPGLRAVSPVELDLPAGDA